MSDQLTKLHEAWIGMVQPIEGLVVSVPVLIDAGVGRPDEAPAVLQSRLLALCPPTRATELGDAGHRIADLSRFLEELLGLTPELFDAAPSLPEDLSLYVPEGHQTIRPTLALRRLGALEEPAVTGDSTPGSRAGSRYVALFWDLSADAPGDALPLDKPETRTGPWEYPPGAKFDRLLRHCRVPVGILTNGEVVRLVYAPHGESSGHIDFRIDDMASVGGRPVLDAFVSLLSGTRFFGVAEEHALPALLAESRKRQANVTTELAEQVFEALQILLRGFQAAAERDPRYAMVFEDARERGDDHLYKGLLAVLLRLVFLLYAEDRSLMPMERPVYSDGLSVLALFARLQRDAGSHPDSMSRRYGAWGQVLALFRAVFLGVDHEELHMPPRRGALFDPHLYPFLEGWGPAGSAPIVDAAARAGVQVPTLDDETVFRVIEKLVVFEGQRLSYKTLDVEQIGSVYEALMGYHVESVDDAAVCLKPDGVWVTAREVMSRSPVRARAKWLKETVGLTTAQAEKLAKSVEELGATADAHEGVRSLLVAHARGGRQKDLTVVTASAGQLVLQPGEERRRTSSHYTPRSLSAPIVRRTLEPLLACMGDAPASDRILDLTICDPAMGSGAFLVEACRFLADQVVAAWTREGKLESIARLAPNEDPVLYARRLVAQRCLYGVDKNESAVELAKLSLWLVTLARDLPFTFLDHSLRWGDSLVGLGFEQIRGFHWKPQKQLGFADGVLREALDESVSIRQRIQELAGNGSADAQREKERLRGDAEDASSRARLIGDVVVGAFFAEEKDKARESERKRRMDLVVKWLGGDEGAGETLREMQREIRAKIPVFHWMLEFPEVFFAERPDPLDEDRVNRAAYMDAFVGNPPFLGGVQISAAFGDSYRGWLANQFVGFSGKSDLVALFFRLCGELIGAHGALGMVATNTIAQGDTRESGLLPLITRAFEVYHADASISWPGAAAVSISVVHLARGHVLRFHNGRRMLNGQPVTSIDSRLNPNRERSRALPLLTNSGASYKGALTWGKGFVIDASTLAAMAKEGPVTPIIRSYVGGEDVASNVGGASTRYVIDFGDRSLDDARAWPHLLRHLELTVEPERRTNKRSVYREKWWLFAEPQRAAFAAARALRRVLVTPRHAKHLIFSFQNPQFALSESLYLFLFPAASQFSVLQSRVHEPWARLLSSSLEDRLRYSASDCFETFPFPDADPHVVLPELEDVGEKLHSAREAWGYEMQQGLTQMYNELKSPDCSENRILAMRRMHLEVDAAVLSAYGWSDLEVPPYCTQTPAEQKAVDAFHHEVIDRLFDLNRTRAADESRRGFGRQHGGSKRVRTSTKSLKAAADLFLDPNEK